MFWFQKRQVIQNNSCFKEDIISFFVLHNYLFVCVQESARACEHMLPPEPKREDSQSHYLIFQEFCSGAGGCFMLDAIANKGNHRIHISERPGQ